MENLECRESVHTLSELPEEDPVGTIRCVEDPGEPLLEKVFYPKKCDTAFYIMTTTGWVPIILFTDQPDWLTWAEANGHARINLLKTKDDITYG